MLTEVNTILTKRIRQYGSRFVNIIELIIKPIFDIMTRVQNIKITKNMTNSSAQNITNSILVPTVIQKSHDGERAYDIYSRLLKDRIVFLGTAIDSTVANLIIAQLLFLENENPNEDIIMYINSPGGHVTAGLAIYDTMQYIKPDVSVVCVGMAASMGAVLLAGGAKGKRFALPNSEVMIHQPLGGTEGQASDIRIHADHIMKTKELLNKILAKHSGQPLKTIERDTDRDNFMDAETAKKYGLIDDILVRRK